MPRIITKKGNAIKMLLDGEANCFFHVVNQVGAMGAGVAAQVKKFFPRTYSDYYHNCKDKKYDLLGEALITEENGITIFNLFAMKEMNKIGPLSYDGFYKSFYDSVFCLNRLRDYVSYDLKVVIPYRIGCDLAGGKWPIVDAMIKTIIDENAGPFIEFAIVEWDGSFV